MSIKLTGDRILVRPLVKSDKTESGLFIPEAYQNASEVAGVVEAVGSGPVTAKGVQLDHFVSVGDTILFSPVVGQETDVFGERLFIMREQDVLAVVEEGEVNG